MASNRAAPESVMDTLFSYDNTIMLAAIISLLLVILFVLLLHLYARWFLSHHHRRNQHLHRASTITTYDLGSSPPPNKEGVTGGLSATAIHSIPTFSYSAAAESSVDCAVCLSEFEEGEVARSLPRCTHCFHVECIDTWLRAHTTCPVCRLDVVLQCYCKEGLDKEDEDRKDDVFLDIRDVDHNELALPESAIIERLMRMAVSRSCRSDVVTHRSEPARPSV